MRIHESVFWGIIFFLVGVFLAPSLTMGGIAMMTGVGMVAVGVIGWIKKDRRKKCTAGLVMLVLVGALYWVGYDTIRKNKTEPLIGTTVSVTGHVVDVRRSEKVQQIRLALDAPVKGVIAVTARAYPRLGYGDAIRVTGLVKRPTKANMQYLIKDAVFASMDFPEVELIRTGGGSVIKRILLGMREKIVGIYERALEPSEAALLAGITIGERATFDKEFTEQMKQSGTTHLVALSGYNITILAMVAVSIAGWAIGGGGRFLIAGGVIALFVLMAGAEASAVRAAIMGSIMLLAQYIGRAHSMRNAIAVSALLMVIWNPNVLRYDLGFQLSFMALIGVVYVKPYMDVWIKRGKEGFLDWRENLSGTTAAQLAVFPIIMHQIGSFSITAVVSNILLLAFIPATMMLGFVVAVLGFVSAGLAEVPAAGAALLLDYEIGVIRAFGSIGGASIEMSAGAVAVYYLVGGWVLVYIRKRMARS